MGRYARFLVALVQGIMLVYDITQQKTFDNIKTWIRNIEQHASEDVEKMILGNKCDMEDKRVISREQGQKASHHQPAGFEPPPPPCRRCPLRAPPPPWSSFYPVPRGSRAGVPRQ
jgi:hypothetical protein